MNKCTYCLCRVCNKVRCPRGKYHCMPCYHGQILDCDFFMHKKVTRIYRVKNLSPSLHVSQLRQLRSTIDSILDDPPASDPQPLTLREALDQENVRHRRELKSIIRKFNNNK